MRPPHEDKRKGLLDDEEEEENEVYSHMQDGCPAHEARIGERNPGSSEDAMAHDAAVLSDTQKARQVMKIVTWIQLVSEACHPSPGTELATFTGPGAGRIFRVQHRHHDRHFEHHDGDSRHPDPPLTAKQARGNLLTVQVSWLARVNTRGTSCSELTSEPLRSCRLRSWDSPCARCRRLPLPTTIADRAQRSTLQVEAVPQPA